MVSFPPVSPPRPYTSPSPRPYAPHAQPISFFSILSPAQYWVRSTNYLARSVVLLNKKIHILRSQVYCVRQVVKTPTIILNKPVFPKLAKKYLHFMKGKNHDPVQNSLQLAPNVSHINTVFFLQTDLFQIHFSIILPSNIWSCKWSLSLSFQHRTQAHTSSLEHTCHVHVTQFRYCWYFV